LILENRLSLWPSMNGALYWSPVVKKGKKKLPREKMPGGGIYRVKLKKKYLSVKAFISEESSCFSSLGKRAPTHRRRDEIRKKKS